VSSSSPKVGVVVAVFNRKAQTREFCRKFREQTYPNADLIIVDDGSSDGTSEMVRTEFPHVLLLSEPGDLWWSKATNLGVEQALKRGAAYILTINDDVECKEDFLAQLVSFAEAHPRTLVGSMIYDLERPGRVWYAGGKRALLFGEMNHRESVEDGKLEWLTGMGTLIPAEAFRTVGYYDDAHFPQYSGDADYSMRAHRAGFQLAIQPASVLWNRIDESGEQEIRRTLSFRNFFRPLTSRKSTSHLGLKFHLIMRHWPPLLAPFAFVLFYAKLFAKQVYWIVFKRNVPSGA